MREGKFQRRVQSVEGIDLFSLNIVANIYRCCLCCYSQLKLYTDVDSLLDVSEV
jgi:hypothetical protein